MFYALKRRNGETMICWITRFRDTYDSTEKSLKRAIKEHGTGLTTVKKNPERVVYTTIEGSSGSVTEEPEHHEGEEHSESSSWADQSWSWDSSWWHAGSWYTREEEEAEEEFLFLPDFVQGWLLLQKTGLDAQERGLILSMSGGRYQLEHIERCLKAQWNDEDLRLRDRNKYHKMALMVEDFDDTEQESSALMAIDDLEEEAQEAYAADEKLIETALAAIQKNQRTLKDARKRQHEVRMGRKFFPPRRPVPESQDKCIKCGGSHKTAQCPDRSDKRLAGVAEEAGFVLVAENQQPDLPVPESVNYGRSSGTVTEEAALAGVAGRSFQNGTILQRGCGIVDGGATSSLGSVEALEKIAAINVAAQGKDMIEVSPSSAEFTFGNGQKKKSCSTVEVQLKMGEKLGKINIHAMEDTGVPILIGINALRKGGAVIDFKRDQLIFQDIDARQVIPLERAPSGHQLLPLVGDLFKKAVTRSTPFLGLCE
eukprot:TRINITY_DN39965_c0_g1_i1.p1 TRINITY_DN39965_c0_g1~~TRINITY_DN39965_c0_g1_i1.p1  ORF type:complete len:483 (-),score=106.00 TRINITY_DN39965_c0_g1_i1:52-1500(-)